MKAISFSQALTAVGLLLLTCTVVASLLTVPWLRLASLAENGPSIVAPIMALCGTVAVALIALGWGVWQERGSRRRKELTAPQALVVAGLLGLGVTGALSAWPALVLSVAQWLEGSRPVDFIGRDLAPLAETFRGGRYLSLGLEEIRVSTVGPLIMQGIAIVMPLVVFGEGLRRLVRKGPVGESGESGLDRTTCVMVLALISFMTACAAAPAAILSVSVPLGVDGPGTAFVVTGDLLPLGIGTVIPIATLCLAALRRRALKLGGIAWLPVVTPLLVLATAGATAAEPNSIHFFSPLAVIGIAFAGLAWAALAFSNPAREPRGTVSLGQVLGAVALVGLMALGASTPSGIDAMRWSRIFPPDAPSYAWLPAILVAGYAINFAVLGAAVWRLRVESQQEPAPEPRGA